MALDEVVADAHAPQGARRGLRPQLEHAAEQALQRRRRGLRALDDDRVDAAVVLRELPRRAALARPAAGRLVAVVEPLVGLRDVLPQVVQRGVVVAPDLAPAAVAQLLDTPVRQHAEAGGRAGLAVVDELHDGARGRGRDALVSHGPPARQRAAGEHEAQRGEGDQRARRPPAHGPGAGGADGAGVPVELVPDRAFLGPSAQFVIPVSSQRAAWNIE